jgi:ABC-type transport system involved in cytochrome bd biosynthesis fused ATPase/permease subunit
MRAFPEMTLITISHRLSSARKMDAVYFLKGPCTIIAADHGTLAQSDAEYNGLFAGQLDAVR